jgi:protein-S-isoprenylcysteine O-methyltransferase Ste14
MEALAIGLLIAWGAVCLALPTVLYVRRTGSSPFIGGRVSGVGAVTAYAIPFAFAIAADDARALPRLFHSWILAGAGTALCVGGIAITVWSQLAMGGSWRVGIDSDEHTALVTTGPYQRVRNPIYTGMFLFTIGVTLVLPNLLSVLGTIGLFVVINVVVSRVEEPYLLKEHGLAFSDWKQTTGRFLPRLTAAA